VLASNGGAGWRWQAGRLGFGIQDTTAVLLPLECQNGQTWGICTFEREYSKTRGRPFWSHAVLAVLANLPTSGPKRRSLRHGVTSQGQAVKASKGRAERSVADFPHPRGSAGLQ